MIKNIITSAIVALVVAVAVIGLVGGNSAKLGGTTNYDSLGLSGTLSVSGITTMATSSVTSLCVYNGTQFTKVSFAAGSTTPAYATSTTCL